MSGDVQPRKRKDIKKRRKDEGDGFSPRIHSPLSSNNSDDINIHVHKEGGTGGNICAKIVFFLLFSALIVLIGLIIKENQGLTDLETSEESRYSQIFEGWVDKNADLHNDHDEADLAFDEDDELDHSAEEQDEHVDELSEEHDSEDEDTVEDAEENDDDDSGIEASEEVEETVEESEETVDESEETDEASEEFDESDAPASDEVEAELEEEQEIDEKDEELSEEKQESVEDNDEEDNNVDSTEDTSSKKDEQEEKDMQKESENLENKSETKEEPKETGKTSGDVKVGADGDDGSDVENANDYEFSNITNKEDYKIKKQLDKGQNELNSNAAFANRIFDTILEKHPLSPRGLYGKAVALDRLAEQRKSNDLLQESIRFYIRVLNADNVPDELFLASSKRCINRIRFIGHYKKAILVHQSLMKRFPENPAYQNDLAVTYLTVNMVEDARKTLKNVLSKWPNDGFALVHYGFILKTTDNKLNESVYFLKKGIETKHAGVVDGRFYFHLGDALARLGRTKEANEIYEDGVKEKLFLSKYQRSLYNVPRLSGKPWWRENEVPYLDLIRKLKTNWKAIMKEGTALLNEKGYFEDEAENLKDKGDWKQLELFARGQKNNAHCKKCPITCNIIEAIPDASKCKRGQTKFSVMHPGTHVWPHCGPTNCRLRIHLGLKVPAGTFLRVAEETRSWKEGDVIVFDDSFEHEVWHNGTEVRLVLIVDVWHPELTSTEKRGLSPI